MADFVLKKHKEFVFALEEDPEVTYFIPALRSLDLEEIQTLSKIDDEKNLTKKGNLVKEFILRHAPDLKDKGLAGMQYFDIYNAYAIHNGSDVGESSASQDS